mmetsp:Transcript_2672/g.4176  ORF Transcript_2672/g.4176 Transcript_2672/m.4176 type:complete len:149 (+) Transcript_2672:453-899(+)
MKQIEQSDDGTIYSIAYQDNGKFFVSVVDNSGTVLDNINVSDIVVIDNLSKPITGFWEPLITVSFIPDDNLFIAAYHRVQKKQYHFTYSYKEKKLMSQVQASEIKGCTPLNFPIKSFYSSITNDCYVFYRQGHGYTINASDPSQFHCE